MTLQTQYTHPSPKRSPEIQLLKGILSTSNNGFFGMINQLGPQFDVQEPVTTNEAEAKLRGHRLYPELRLLCNILQASRKAR